MKNYTWEYIQKYPKQTKRLLGIDYQQLEQLMALGKFLHHKNKSEIEKIKIRINQPGSGTPPKLSAMGTNCFNVGLFKASSKLSNLRTDVSYK
jgi:hypothetical protein